MSIIQWHLHGNIMINCYFQWMNVCQNLSVSGSRLRCVIAVKLLDIFTIISFGNSSFNFVYRRIIIGIPTKPFRLHIHLKDSLAIMVIWSHIQQKGFVEGQKDFILRVIVCATAIFNCGTGVAFFRLAAIREST